MTITIAELLKDIDDALALPDDSDLPVCGPGEICPAYLKYHYDMTQGIANRTIREWLKAGKVERAWISYTDLWGDVRSIKGYRMIDRNNGAAASD